MNEKNNGKNEAPEQQQGPSQKEILRACASMDNLPVTTDDIAKVLQANKLAGAQAQNVALRRMLTEALNMVDAAEKRIAELEVNPVPAEDKGQVVPMNRAERRRAGSEDPPTG